MGMIDNPAVERLGRFLDLTAYRASVIAGNMANVDTPGFHTRDINFRAELQRASADPDVVPMTPAAHEVRGLNQRPDGNNVSLERESLLLAETQLKFRTAVQLLRAEFRRLSTAINEGNRV